MPLVIPAPPPTNVQPHLPPRQPSKAELEVCDTPHSVVKLGSDTYVTTEPSLGRENLRRSAHLVHAAAEPAKVNHRRFGIASWP